MDELATARLLIDVFQPRTDVFAVRWDEQHDVDRYNEWLKSKSFKAAPAVLGGYKPAGARDNRTKLTPEEVVRHLRGEKTIGVYPMVDGQYCNVIAADFDNHRGDLILDANPIDDYQRIARLLNTLEIPYLAWHSRGGKGYWVALLPPLRTSARDARAVLFGLLRRAGVQRVPEGTLDDLFPKQDVLTVDEENPTRNTGNLFALPLSKKWAPGSLFVGVDSSNWNAQVEHLRNARRIDETLWAELVAAFPPLVETVEHTRGDQTVSSKPSAWYTLLQSVGFVGTALGGEKHALLCVNDAQHSTPDGSAQNAGGSCYLHPANTPRNIGWPHCSHAHCSDLKAVDWLNASLVILSDRVAKAPDALSAAYSLTHEFAAIRAIDSEYYYATARRKLKELCKELRLNEFESVVKKIRFDDKQITVTLQGYELTDAGNAARYVDANKDTLRYAAFRGTWLVWAGTHWIEDDHEANAWSHVFELAATLMSEARAEPDEDRRHFCLQHAAHSQSLKGLEAIPRLVKKEQDIRLEADQVNRDPWVFNVQNGTINLHTGALQPHRPEDFIDRVSGVSFDPTATCPRWNQFVAEIMPDASMQKYLQALMGYSLTGLTTEHMIAIFWGETGGNGKSTFIRVMQRLFGPYFQTISRDLLLAGSTGKHPTGLTDLDGARLVVASETDDDDTLDQALVKSLTGGDAIKARKMRQDFYTFEPTHKVVLVTNPRPRVRGNDMALKRRAHLIPWEAQFTDPHGTKASPGAKTADLNLFDKLIAELPGILNWAVQGCLAWQRDGLVLPEIARAATETYFEEEDTVFGFFQEMCTFEEKQKITRKGLWLAYVAWCRTSEIKPLTERGFSTRVRQQLQRQHRRDFRIDGHERQGTIMVRVWKGIFADRSRILTLVVDNTEPTT